MLAELLKVEYQLHELPEHESSEADLTRERRGLGRLVHDPNIAHPKWEELII